MSTAGIHRIEQDQHVRPDSLDLLQILPQEMNAQNGVRARAPVVAEMRRTIGAHPVDRGSVAPAFPSQQGLLVAQR